MNHFKEMKSRQISATHQCRLGVDPDSKAHRANKGPTWGQQDPGGPHVGPMNFVIWSRTNNVVSFVYSAFYKISCRWLSSRLQQHTGDMAVLHWAIDVSLFVCSRQSGVLVVSNGVINRIDNLTTLALKQCRRMGWVHFESNHNVTWCKQGCSRDTILYELSKRALSIYRCVRNVTRMAESMAKTTLNVTKTDAMFLQLGDK